MLSLRNECREAGLKCGPIGTSSMRNTWIKRLSAIKADIEFGKEEQSSGSDYEESDLDERIVLAAEAARNRSFEKLIPESVGEEVGSEERSRAVEDTDGDFVTAHVTSTRDELNVSTGEESSKLRIFMFSLVFAILAFFIKQYANIL